jgi:hypothetical protein
MQSFWGNMTDDSDAQVWWASQQEATKVENDQGNNSIKRKRSQLEMVFPLVLLNRIRPVSYSIYVLTTDGLLVTKVTRWALTYNYKPLGQSGYSKLKPLRPCMPRPMGSGMTNATAP